MLGDGYNICEQSGLYAGAEWADLYSPNYPNSYGNNQNCEIVIQNDDGTVELEIQSYSLEKNYDFLKIAGLSGPEKIGSYTGNFGGGMIIPLESSTYSVRIRFTSDQSNTGQGFHLKFRAGKYSYFIYLRRNLTLP